MKRKTSNARRARFQWNFQPHPDAEERWRSALQLLKAIVNAKFVSEKHKRKMLRIAVYELTEIHGKHNLRYKSIGCRSGKCAEIEHEHVFARKDLVEAMMQKPRHLQQIAKKAVACLVTKPEHKRLCRKGKGLTGWKRYQAAGITVFDTKTGKRRI